MPWATMHRRLGGLFGLLLLIPLRTATGATPPEDPGFTAKYELQDTKSRVRTVQNYRGKIQLVFFGFTHCPDVCPTGLARITSALEGLETETRSKIQPIFISIDPERDEPKVIEAYLSRFSPAWVGLRGTPEATESVLRNFHVLAFREHADHEGHYSMTHTSLVYGIGADARALGSFDTNHPASELTRVLRRWAQR